MTGRRQNFSKGRSGRHAPNRDFARYVFLPAFVEFFSYCGRVDRDIREEEDEDEICIVEERRGYPSGSSPHD